MLITSGTEYSNNQELSPFLSFPHLIQDVSYSGLLQGGFEVVFCSLEQSRNRLLGIIRPLPRGENVKSGLKNGLARFDGVQDVQDGDAIGVLGQADAALLALLGFDDARGREILQDFYQRRLGNVEHFSNIGRGQKLKLVLPDFVRDEDYDQNSLGK